jgi:hypothetical protein
VNLLHFLSAAFLTNVSLTPNTKNIAKPSLTATIDVAGGLQLIAFWSP